MNRIVTWVLVGVAKLTAGDRYQYNERRFNDGKAGLPKRAAPLIENQECEIYDYDGRFSPVD